MESEGISWVSLQPESPLVSKVESIFQNVVEPIYGSQQSSFERIKKAKDRQCELLIRTSTDEILGLIVYKTRPHSDHKHYGVSNSFEIKNFLILEKNSVEPETEFTDMSLSNARKMYMKLQELALQAGADNLHIIISEKQVSVYSFIKSQNFMERKRWKLEQLLSCGLRNQQIRTTAAQSRAFRVTLHNQYIRAIRDGQKTVEGRCATNMFTPIRRGRIIEFFCRTDSVKCEVVSVKKYSSFHEMLRHEGVNTCLPGIRSLKEACDVYSRIPGYTEKAARYGVVAFTLRAIQ